MPTLSDGDDSVDANSMSDTSFHHGLSPGEVALKLQNFLDEKEKQLRHAGELGQKLIEQQAELEEFIRRLREWETSGGAGDDDDYIAMRVQELCLECADSMKGWDVENEQLTTTFWPKHLTEGVQLSPGSVLMDLEDVDIQQVERSLERSKTSTAGPSAAQSSRRAKNAARQENDVEFAFEIGNGLLSEVRRLQALLIDRDKSIQDGTEERDDLQRTVEALREALREQERSADKFKEENWNLEITLQEMRSQLTDSQSIVQRLEGEQKRLTKMLTTARETADHHKNESEKHHNSYLELKAKHETDVAQARRHAASLQRDKSDLQQIIDSLKAEAAKSSRKFPRFGSPLTPGGAPASDVLTPSNADEDDVFSGATGGASTNNRKRFDSSQLLPEPFDSEFGDSSPDPSPSKPFLAPNHPSNEIEALQQRLAHAQRQINTLKATLQREKELRIEYKRKLDMSPGYAVEEEVGELEEEVEEEVEQPKPKRRLTPYRAGRGRGRGRRQGGLTLIQRLGMAASSPSSEFNDDDDDLPEPSPLPPVPPLPAAFQDEVDHNVKVEVEEDEEPNLHVSPSPPSQAQLNRASVASVDGMDPVFANVLRRSGSGSSLRHNGSPLRHSIVARSSRGGAFFRRSRGGAAYQAARPPSLVGQPEALAAELGITESLLDDESVVEQETMHAVETAEFGCQTDLDVPPPPPPIHISPATTEAAVQVDPEPAPEIVKLDISLQTYQEDAPTLVDIGVQHEAVEPRIVYASSSTNTEPELKTVYASISTATEPEPKSEPEPERLQPMFAQAEVQTSTADVADADIQTVPEPTTAPVEKVDIDTHTQLSPSAEVEIQTLVLVAEAEVQIDDFQPADHSSTYGDSSGDTTINGRPASLLLLDNDDIDYETEAETSSILPTTDTDEFQDARQSVSLTTPTDSMDDFHSIRTVSDNDFSSDDEGDNESIKASRLPSRLGLNVASSATDVAGPSPLSPAVFFTPAPTYEDKAVSADLTVESEHADVVVEEPKVEPPPETQPEPKPELKEMSIQTDDWSPPVIAAPPTSVRDAAPVPVRAAVPVSSPVASPVSVPAPISASVPVSVVAPSPAPAAVSIPASAPAPAPSPVPALFRVNSTQQRNASTQQFQFISPPASAGPTTTSLPVVSAPSPNNSSRDSNTTFVARPRTTQSDRRQSIESTLSSVMDDLVNCSRTPSTVPNVIDKSRPPMMVLPPPPRQPPPSNSMLPPQFIPEKRISHDIPPPRPSSPPPAELIQRATTPTFGAALAVSGGRSFVLRQHGSMPPSQEGLRQPPSTSSFRSAVNAASRAPLSSPTPSTLSFGPRERERRELSSISLNSGRQSMGSQRSSISSGHHVYDQQSNKLPTVTPDRSINRNDGSTDPVIIHAITQTMIGEFLYKYTRRALGKGHGSSRHKRFFWVHPYTRTLYWSSADPGSSNVSESSAKSAYIEGVRAVLDPNPMPPGIYQYSVVVSTPQREMKFTAPTKERHDIWINALNYLLTRSGSGQGNSPGGAGPTPLSPMSMDADLPEDESQQAHHVVSSPQSHRSAVSRATGLSVDSWNVTPRGQRSRSQISLGGSMGKRSGTPAAEYLRWSGYDNPHSPTKEYEHIPAQDDEDLDFELHEDTMSDGGFEGLENVRACCDGRHTVGRSGKVHHHHHHHHQRSQSIQREPSSSRDQHLDAALQNPPRPASPAWSFRSRAGSSTSHDGASFFSRFGTRRSAKAVPGKSVGAHDQ